MFPYPWLTLTRRKNMLIIEKHEWKMQWLETRSFSSFLCMSWLSERQANGTTSPLHVKHHDLQPTNTHLVQFFPCSLPSSITRMRTPIAERAIAVVQEGDAVIRPSKIPPRIRFPLVVILSLTLSSLLYSFTADYTDLASVSRSFSEPDALLVAVGLVGWRTWVVALQWLGSILMRCYRFELGLGWFGNYDGYDLAALSLLSHGPLVRYSVIPFCAWNCVLTF